MLEYCPFMLNISLKQQLLYITNDTIIPFPIVNRKPKKENIL
jgi:hypothetical protein